jgi:hypothetical protein
LKVSAFMILSLPFSFAREPRAYFLPPVTPGV